LKQVFIEKIRKSKKNSKTPNHNILFTFAGKLSVGGFEGDDSEWWRHHSTGQTQFSDFWSSLCGHGKNESHAAKLQILCNLW